MFRQIALAAGLSMVATAGLAQSAETAPEAGSTAPAQQPQVAQTQETAPQPGAIDPAAAYEAARNQLGILKYCETQGFAGADAVAAQEKLVGMLPEGDTTAGASAEQKGSEGTVSLGETEISLADAASQQGTTEESQCQRIEAAVNQVASQLSAG